MIFFRERRILLRFKKNPGDTPQGFFVRVRADFEGSIDPKSGMVLNLVDVDRALKTVLSKDVIYRSRFHAVRTLSKDLKNIFPKHFKTLSLKSRSLTLSLTNEKVIYQYQFSTRFKEPNSVNQRLMRIKSETPLKSAWRKSFRHMTWLDVKECVRTLKGLKAPVIDVEIERPELGGWERWSIVETS